MQELEKILEEINKRIDRSMLYSYQHAEGLREAKGIIRKHMNDSKCGNCSRRKWYQIGYKDRKNDGWIPVEERLPEDRETVLCTDGECVYLVEYDADLDAPFGEMEKITDWQPSPEPYRPEQPETCKYTGGSCCWPIDQCSDCSNHPERGERE